MAHGVRRRDRRPPENPEVLSEVLGSDADHRFGPGCGKLLGKLSQGTTATGNAKNEPFQVISNAGRRGDGAKAPRIRHHNPG